MTSRFFCQICKLVLALGVVLTACTSALATVAPAVPAPQAIVANQGWQSASYFVHGVGQ